MHKLYETLNINFNKGYFKNIKKQFIEEKIINKLLDKTTNNNFNNIILHDLDVLHYILNTTTIDTKKYSIKQIKAIINKYNIAVEIETKKTTGI